MKERGTSGGMEITSTDLLSFDPSCSDVWNACMSYRHDFGLLPDAEQKTLEFEAREWLRAWGHTLPQFKSNAGGDAHGNR